jgi:hypothetical protein
MTRTSKQIIADLKKDLRVLKRDHRRLELTNVVLEARVARLQAELQWYVEDAAGASL